MPGRSLLVSAGIRTLRGDSAGSRVDGLDAATKSCASGRGPATRCAEVARSTVPGSVAFYVSRELWIFLRLNFGTWARQQSKDAGSHPWDFASRAQEKGFNQQCLEKMGNYFSMANRSTSTVAQSAPSYAGPFIMITALFFIFGFITTLNMALVPHLGSIFNLNYAWAMLADSAFFLAYFVFSAPSSKLIEIIGYKRTMVVSLFIQVVGALLFVPAAKLVNFPLFLSAVFIVGAGVTALQTAANPYVAILGSEHSAPVRLTLAQAFNSIGAAIAPLVAGAFILADPTKLISKARIAETVRAPYLLIAAGLLLLGLAVAFMRLPPITQTQAFLTSKESGPVPIRSIWSYKHTALGALSIFLYVGVEVGLASIAVNYFKGQGRNSAKTASFLVSLYWFGALIGRLLGSWVLTKIQSGRLLGIYGIAAAVLVSVSMVTSVMTV
jgi:MFS transporter, FHS family, L-fucose permease